MPVPLDRTEFRNVMGHFATGVAIITSHDGEGRIHGLTANAVSSVSLDPPLVLVCIDKSAETYPCFGASKVFAINLLTREQEHLSRRFAKSGGEKFAGLDYRIGSSGAPILTGALAHLECEIRHEFHVGDHTIYVGEPVGVATDAAADPLLFFRGRYCKLG